MSATVRAPARTPSSRRRSTSPTRVCESGARSQWKLKFGPGVPSLLECTCRTPKVGRCREGLASLSAPAVSLASGHPWGAFGDPVRAVGGVDGVSRYEPQAVEQPAVVGRGPRVEGSVVGGVDWRAPRVREGLRPQPRQDVAHGARPRRCLGVPFRGRTPGHCHEEWRELGGAGCRPRAVRSRGARRGLSGRRQACQRVGTRRRWSSVSGRSIAPASSGGRVSPRNGRPRPDWRLSAFLVSSHPWCLRGRLERIYRCMVHCIHWWRVVHAYNPLVVT